MNYKKQIFYEKNIIEYVTSYNNCVNADVEYIKDNSSSRGRLGIKGGIGFSKHLVKNQAATVFSYGFIPNFGITYKKTFDKNRGRNAMQLDFFYNRFNTENDGSPKLVENINLLTFDIFYKMNFYELKFNPFVKIGYQFSRELSTNGINSLNVLGTQNHGLIGGIGISLNKIDFDFLCSIPRASNLKSDRSFIPIALSLNGYYYFN